MFVPRPEPPSGEVSLVTVYRALGGRLESETDAGAIGASELHPPIAATARTYVIHRMLPPSVWTLAREMQAFGSMRLPLTTRVPNSDAACAIVRLFEVRMRRVVRAPLL
jgi:hypothetical protein